MPSSFRHFHSEQREESQLYGTTGTSASYCRLNTEIFHIWPVTVNTVETVYICTLPVRSGHDTKLSRHPSLFKVQTTSISINHQTQPTNQPDPRRIHRPQVEERPQPKSNQTSQSNQIKSNQTLQLNLCCSCWLLFQQSLPTRGQPQ